MVTLGFEPHFTDGDIALIVAVVIGFGLVSALPATGPLALIGHWRAAHHPRWNALWYWFWGTALTLASVITFLFLELEWWSIPLSWPLPWFLAWILRPRQRPAEELRWTQTTPR